jgi:hypothetical protein
MYTGECVYSCATDGTLNLLTTCSNVTDYLRIKHNTTTSTTIADIGVDNDDDDDDNANNKSE